MAAIIARLIIARREADKRKEASKKARDYLTWSAKKSGTEIQPFGERFDPKEHNLYLRVKYLNKLKQKQEEGDKELLEQSGDTRNINNFHRFTGQKQGHNLHAFEFEDFPFFMLVVILVSCTLWFGVLGYLGYVYFSVSSLGPHNS